MTNVSYHVCYIIGLLIVALILHLFYSATMRRGKLSIVLFCGAYVVVIALASAVHLFADSLMVNAIVLLAFAALASLLYSGHWVRKVVCSMVVFITILFAEIVIAVWAEYGVYFAPAEDQLYYVGMVIVKVLLCVVIAIWHRQCMSSNNKTHQNTILLLFVCYVVITFVVNMAIMYRVKDLDLELLFMVVANILLVTILYAYTKQLNEQYISRNKAIAESHQQEQSQMLTDYQHEADRARHDFRNQLYAIRDTLSTDIEQGLVEIDKALDIQNNTSMLSSTGVSSLDALIAGKRSAIAREKIQFKCTSFIVGLGRIDPIDLCVIVGNLLDNAIEAAAKCTHGKTVELHITTVANTLNIYISNNYSHSIITNGNKVYSTKSDSTQHGFGLESVVDIANKYDGTVNIDHSNNTFIVDVSLVS